ncbi:MULTISPECIES: hypothetical protein [unclassified Acinetobacter]|uniref:hypothetical protein n=1 Tax=unclassified Acinetobacter TaxID=196816 RepID=UPI000EA10902|nr:MULTISPECIES: hypothetical protein [unclassified Acinetobacter]MBI1452953.1 hypothetical protein [Acinetobacter sp. FL51]RKG37587.1 hypothetical protein D7V31_16485 [Acinetobacter sp. WCHAc060007]
MRVMGIDDSNSVVVEEGAKLPKFIRTLKIETAEEEQQLRLFLTGTLRVDKDGCHSMGRDFGSNALCQSSDVSNGNVALGMKPKGSCALADGDTSKGILKLDYSIEEKLRIIEILSSAIQRNEPMIYPHTKEAEGKLLALIQSI